MDISRYYRTVSVKDNVIHIELKGNWSDEVVAQIGDEYLRLFKQAIDSIGGERFIILADLSRLIPGPRSGEFAVEALKYAKAHNLYKSVEVISAATTQISVKDAAMAVGKDDFRIVVTSLSHAQEEVAKIQQEL